MAKYVKYEKGVGVSSQQSYQSAKPSKGNPGYFNQSYFGELVNSIFQDSIDATGNAGQVAILEQMYENSIDAILQISSIGRRPNKTIYKSAMLLGSSPEKFNAVSIICEEIAEKLCKAWDDAMGGDASGIKLYMDLGPDYFNTNTPTMNALQYGLRASMIMRGL